LNPGHAKEEDKHVQTCRNCGSANLRELGFIGVVAPFFLKRVLNTEVKTLPARHRLRLFAQKVCVLPKRLLDRVYRSGPCVEMQICLDCSFVQAKHAFSDEALGRLYVDYRSSTYNQERTHYEPGYAALSKEVGIGAQEIKARVGGLNAWLKGKIAGGGDFSMLDFGGSNGRFLPELEGRRFVFEISDVAPLPGIVRIANEADLGTYSYLQIAHVLEHVSDPLALVKRVSRYIEPSGYLYIEVPQELSDPAIEELKSGPVRTILTVHEHINVYCSSSIRHLVEAAGLEPVSIETGRAELGWVGGDIVRALCRKPA
jgi:hypothetical protein